MKTALLDCRESRYFFKGAYGENVALGESNAEIGLTSATTTLLLFCVFGCNYEGSAHLKLQVYERRHLAAFLTWRITPI